jgi:hypothetical protein
LRIAVEGGSKEFQESGVAEVGDGRIIISGEKPYFRSPAVRFAGLSDIDLDGAGPDIGLMATSSYSRFSSTPDINTERFRERY